MKRIKIDRDTCVGCMSCSVACMLSHSETENIHQLDIDNLDNGSRNHIGLADDGKYVPIFCRHCDRPECTYTCMAGAMTKNLDTGRVEYNSEKCASCFMCIMACPYGVLKADNRNHKTILKCDLCAGRDEPSCVNNCPTGAIRFEEVE